MKNFIIYTFFAPEELKAHVNYATKSYPELKKLGLPPEQERARAKALAKLDEYINDISKFSRGNKQLSGGLDGASIAAFLKQSVTLDSTMEGIQRQMKDIRSLLLKSYSESDWIVKIETHLNKINGDGTANLETIATTMSKRVFLQRIIGGTEAAKILQPAVIQSSANEKQRLEEKREISVDAQKQKSRLEQFLVAIESEGDGLVGGAWRSMTGKAGIDSEIRHTQNLLNQGKIEEAKSYASEKFDGRWSGVKIANIVSSNQGLAEALRALKHTDAAEKVLLETVADDKNNKENQEKRNNASDKQKDFYDVITQEKVLTESEKHKNQAQEFYQKAIEALPINDPDRKEMEASPDKYINGFANALALKNLVSDYIRTHGSKDLPTEMMVLDDMRGLHGKMNFTDENARLFKEIAILIGSMALTLGASAIPAGAAATARGVVAAGRMAKAGQAAMKVPGVRHVGKAIGAVNSVVGRNAVTGALYQGAVFTTADAALRSTFLGSDGDRKGFANFMDNVLKNSAMFASFAGMEKFLTSEAIRKIPFIRGMKVDPNQPVTFRNAVGNTVKLSVGDIAVMQALYAAETGKLETDWKALAAIVTFRGLTQIFPNIMAKAEERQRTTNSVSQSNVSRPTSSPSSQSNVSRPTSPPSSQSNVSRPTSSPSSQSNVSRPSVSGVSQNNNNINNVTVKNFNSVDDYILSHPRETQDRVNNISQQIGKIDSDTIVAIPFYAKENAEGLFSALQAQVASGEKIVIYLNAPKTGKYAISETDFANRLKDLQRITANDKRFVIAHHHYDDMQTIGTIRSDMVDAIALSSKGVKNPILVGLDADTYKLSKDYIQTVRKHFQDNPSIDWSVSQLRWGVPGVDKASWLSERIMQTSGGARPKKLNESNTWSSGGSSSFRLDAYTRVGGYNRTAKLGEDTMLGEAMNQARGQFSGSRLGAKVSVDPRRGTQSVESGNRFVDQWNGDFVPVNKSLLNPDKLKNINNAVEGARTGKALNQTEIAELEGFINMHYQGLGNNVGQKTFSRFWNMTAKDSQYLMIVDDSLGKIKLMTKTDANAALNKISPNSVANMNAGIQAVKNGNPEKFKSFFNNHWKSIASGMLGLTILRNALEREKTNPYYILPEELSTDPQVAFEQCMLCFQNVEESTINYTRKSVSGRELTEDYRIDISRRWMQKQEWKDLMTEWNNTMSELQQMELEGVTMLQEKIGLINENPTVAAVKDLQRCINMIAEDNAAGQDGILGPNTTNAIREFITTCRAQYVIMSDENVPQISGDNQQESEVQSQSTEIQNTGVESQQITQSINDETNVASTEVLSGSNSHQVTDVSEDGTDNVPVSEESTTTPATK